MAIALTGAGSLFVRWGHILGPLQDLNALRGGKAGPQVGTGAGWPTRFATIDTDLGNGTALSKTRGRAADNPFNNLAQFQASGFGGAFAWAKTLMADILGAMYNLDQPTALLEDAPYNLQAALIYLIGQMVGATLSTPSSTVQACTAAIGAQTAGTVTPAGNPVIVASAKNVQGALLQLMFPETITVKCTRDSQGGAAAGSETLTFYGETAAGDSPAGTAFVYPGGSGAQVGYTLVNGELSNSGGNVLQNSGMAKFTNANIPDNWVKTVGIIGTDILDGGSGNVYTTGNTHVLQLHGDGATLVALTQSFATAPSTTLGAGGTSYALLPDTQYAVSMFVKVLSTVPAAGVLELALVDGANNVLADDFGNNNLTTFDLTSGGLNIGASYVNVNTVFRTPANLMTQTTPFALRLRQSTAITSGKSAYVARLAMALMTPLYNGGPFFQCFSGNANTINGAVPDAWTVAVSNNYSTTAHGLFQQWLDRVFGLRAILIPTGGTPVSLQFPYAASPTVADSLIA